MASSRRNTRLHLETLEDRCVPATFTVKNLNDAGPGSLRALVDKANMTNAPDTIVFNSTLKGTIDVTALSGEILITKSLVINGPGAGRITVDGNLVTRIFNVDDLDLDPNKMINVTIRGLTLTQGQSFANNGGAIRSNENLTVSKVNIRDNQVTAGIGGGIYASGGSLTVLKSSLSGNIDGGVVFEGTSMKADGCSFFDNRGAFSGLSITGASSTALITNCTIANNLAKGGGGVYSVGDTTLRRCTITGNRSDIDGGGVFANAGSKLTVDACTIVGNWTGSSGGGLTVRGTAEILNSTIAYNTAMLRGGGIHTAGGAADLKVRNSTISGNTAVTDGGGMALLPGSMFLVQNSTVAFNRAGGNGGGIFADNNVALESTIVAKNFAAGTGNDLISNDNPGDEITLIRCLIGELSPMDADYSDIDSQLNVDPMLGPLVNNGGPTQTHALLPGSAAINNGSNPAALLTDQRGDPFKRTKGGFTDIGAFEL